MTFEQGQQIILEQLKRKDFSRAGLSTLLVQRGMDASDAFALVEHFTNLGYVDDAKFRARFFESALLTNMSRQRIDQHLRAKGLAPLSQEEEQSCNARDIEFVKVALCSQKITCKASLRKVTNRLLRRGFDQDLVMETACLVLHHLEDIVDE